MELQVIQNKIYEIRGERVMFDFDLAELYDVETKELKQSVKRNIKRFPPDFLFELTKKEYDFLRSQFVTLDDNDSESKRGKRTFGGICNAVVQHCRISNSTKIKSGNTIAAQRKEPVTICDQFPESLKNIQSKIYGVRRFKVISDKNFNLIFQKGTSS